MRTTKLSIAANASGWTLQCPNSFAIDIEHLTLSHTQLYRLSAYERTDKSISTPHARVLKAKEHYFSVMQREREAKHEEPELRPELTNDSDEMVEEVMSVTSVEEDSVS